MSNHSSGSARPAFLAVWGLCAAIQGCSRDPGAARPDHGAPPATGAATAAPAAAPGAGPAGRFHFVDVAAQVGITRITWGGRPGKDHLMDSAGTGAAFLDYNRDGRRDLYVVNGWKLEGSKVVERGLNALYRQRQDGTFDDVTRAAGVGGEGHWGAGVFAADYDGDNWTDLLVTNFGPNLLYRNRGDGTFENVAGKLGIESPGWNTGAAFFDAEGDRDLDIFIAGYIDCSIEEILEAKPTLDWKGLEMVAFGPFGLKGAPDHYFRNDGGKFVDATEEAGFEDKALAFGFSVRAADFDDDGDLDVYVANDSDPNYLYRNEGGGKFKEIAVWAGCSLSAGGMAQASMGVAVGDVDGDAILDIVVNNFAEDWTTLYRGLGEGFFEDVTTKYDLQKTTYRSLSWGAVLADLDNDGDDDLVIANGHIYPQIDQHPEIIGTYAQKNQIFENRDGKALAEVTESAGPGFALVLSSRGIAAGDHDNDGDIDLVITNLDAPPNVLRNESRCGSWLEVECEVPKGGPPLIGTRVTVTCRGRKLLRDVASGDSYMSTHDPRLHFGLGKAEAADKVEVRWTDGTQTVRENVPARQILKIQKGS